MIDGAKSSRSSSVRMKESRLFLENYIVVPNEYWEREKSITWNENQKKNSRAVYLFKSKSKFYCICHHDSRDLWFLDWVVFGAVFVVECAMMLADVDEFALYEETRNAGENEFEYLNFCLFTIPSPFMWISQCKYAMKNVFRGNVTNFSISKNVRLVDSSHSRGPRQHGFDDLQGELGMGKM